jgi:mRNA-degrading endonuclease HigB of HigAB toxin-antitoxin module
MKEKMRNMEQVAQARESEMKILKNEAARKEFESPDDKKKFKP